MDLEKNKNVTQSSEYLGVSRVTFYKLIKRYDLKPVERIATMNFFHVKDLDRVKTAIAETYAAS